MVLSSPWSGGLLIKGFVLSQAGQRLGHPVRAGGCRLGWMRVVLSDVDIEGMGHIGRLAAGPGEIELDEPQLEIEREEMERLAGRHKGKERGSPSAGGAEAKGSGRHILVRNGEFIVEDRQRGIQLQIGDLQCDLRGRTGTVKLGDLQATLPVGARAKAKRIELVFADAGPQAIAIQQGELRLWKGLALTGIEGTVLPQLALTGGYGGVGQTLWRAAGKIDYAQGEADAVVQAERFTLEKLAPLLGKETPVLDPKKATVSGGLDITARRGKIGFSGQLHVAGLDIGDKALGQKPVRDLAFDARIGGSLWPKERRLVIDQAVVQHQGVKVALTGAYDGSGARPKLEAQLKVPEVSCQMALAAIPPPLVPAIGGFKLKGNFETDVHIAIDWNDLQSLELGGKVGIDGCKVVEAPPDFSAEKLLQPFDHRVEVEPGHDLDFAVGPDNPDWAPFTEISPYIVNSLMTTEDNGFFKHRGFITREFRTALIQNLERGYFRLGASSITMQMIKNVLLSREKTLSRKFQELFLTWYLEQFLPKERIFEIYLNVIEFGPGIYGIGRAMHHYFGKPPHDASPKEAAFFSSILPNPKRRYVHYCHGQLTDKWEQYLNRILRRMHERERLTDAEFTEATTHPLVFDRKEARPEKECLDYIKRLTTAVAAPADTELDVKEIEAGGKPKPAN